jgi:predicted nucleic acid-binding protein
MTVDALPHGSVIVIDTSVLIALGRPENEKFQRFEQFVTATDSTVHIPEYVAAELGESPDTYRYQREQLAAASAAGWAQSVSVAFDDPEVSSVVDRTRERMAAVSADDVTEDEIEKTDAVLAGVAYQLASDHERVGVLVSDTVAERAIADVLAASGCETVRVVDGRAFIQALFDDAA